jgi:hypothetical protein
MNIVEQREKSLAEAVAILMDRESVKDGLSEANRHVTSSGRQE